MDLYNKNLTKSILLKLKLIMGPLLHPHEKIYLLCFSEREGPVEFPEKKFASNIDKFKSFSENWFKILINSNHFQRICEKNRLGSS